jgi:hypothetical protein
MSVRVQRVRVQRVRQPWSVRADGTTYVHSPSMLFYILFVHANEFSRGFKSKEELSEIDRLAKLWETVKGPV